jgi:rhamnulose-1-phosphate aldolase/alcohol dehydrogenase
VQGDLVWDEGRAAGLGPLERLVYRSNLLGADRRITNTGGGNTSTKTSERDSLNGAEVEVLWVKGSGGDLRTAGPGNFASLYLDRLRGLETAYPASGEKGPKTAAEDRLVGLYPHCTFGLNPRAASIDTPLHALLPARCIDHVHPDAVIAVAACSRGEALTEEIWGGEVAWAPWQRPGYDLGLVVREIERSRPGLKGIVLDQHGLLSWGDDDRSCFENTLELIDRATRFIAARDRGADTFGGVLHEPLPPEHREELLVALLPWLRGLLSRTSRMIATVQDDEAMLRFTGSRDAPRLSALGTSCPDHFLRTKIKPLLVPWDPAGGDLEGLKHLLVEGVAEYREGYRAYYERCRRPDSPPMREAAPTVVLIPGLGMVAWGKSKSESRVTAEFYLAAVEVMRGAEALGGYVALPEQEAFDIEYWALEEAKLRRMPPEQEFARRVVLVAGAGSGIGREVSLRLAGEGAQMVCADRDEPSARATAEEVVSRSGPGIGVAGTGISGCGPAVGLDVDITDRGSVRALIARAVLAYGGVDDLVVTAGLYPSPDREGRVEDSAWRQAFEVNAFGGWLLCDELRPVWTAQGLEGAVVLTTSVNAVVAKRGSPAYDASKAAANHLVRELAMELAPLVRVNAVAPATVVAGSGMFPRERVIASLAKYGLPCSEDESDEVLRDRLAGFYAGRTLLGAPITPAHQAEAVRFLLGRSAARTTGQVLTVDGGLPEAFLR